jgi:hypothetical protein
MFISLWKLEYGYAPVVWSEAMRFKEKTFPILNLDTAAVGITSLEDDGIFKSSRIENNRSTAGRYTQLVNQSEPVSIMESNYETR